MAIKKLQNNFTTPEQSKRLLELGVPADSADCYYIYSMTSFQDKSSYIIPPDYKYSDGIPNGYESRFCPCWSVGRLMEISLICHTDEKVLLSFCKANANCLIYQMMMAFENHMNNLDFSKLEE